MNLQKSSPLYRRIREIIESARAGAARSVNTAQVVANWLVGREIVEEEQKGKSRAGYGEKLIAELSARITAQYGKGYSVNNLEHFRDFYRTYPELLSDRIPHALRGESEIGSGSIDFSNSHASRGQSWRPGLLNSNLSWS